METKTKKEFSWLENPFFSIRLFDYSIIPL